MLIPRLGNNSTEFCISSQKGTSFAPIQFKLKSNCNEILRNNLDSKKDKVVLSKTLSWLLRHAATTEGLDISPDGYIPVTELLKHRNLKNKYTLEDVQDVVSTNDKQRFHLRTTNGILEIRANQGHSLNTVDDLDFTPITSSSSVTDVVHGTYLRCLNDIKKYGLSKMKRNHIHFAPGLPNKNIISGMRQNAQVYIFVDIDKALQDGIKFFKSANGVILSPGNEQGFLEPKYFSKVCKADGQPI